MNEEKKLEKRREQILEEMRALRTMRKGSVLEQYLKVKLRGEREPVLRGPYWLYTRKEKGKTVGRRLEREEADKFRTQVSAAHQFQSLCSEYAAIAERLADLEESTHDTSREKKRRRLRLSKTPK